MRKLLLFILLVLCAQALKAQKPQADTAAYVEIQPEFPGSISNMMTYLSDEINFPKSMRTERFQGRVVVTFVVIATGEIDQESIQVMSSECFTKKRRKLITMDNCTDLEQEAMRVVSKMPVWKPGYQNGKAVPVVFSLPIKFVSN